MTVAREIAPALTKYSGGATEPARWSCWTPRQGDILVCTPPKSGTTWTQSMLAMLVNGGPDLPAPVPVISPWVDANLGIPADEVRAAISAQTGRRVIKTHTPSDGFPIWDGVTVIAVYRHPLDVFFSLRKHVANTAAPMEVDAPYLAPLPEAFQHFVTGGVDRSDFGRDTLAKFALQYTQTACLKRQPDLKVFHYTDFVKDGHAAVAQLARAIGIDDPDLIDRVAEATSFSSMKSNAGNFAPAAGTGYWRADGGFFDSATSGKWDGQLSEQELQQFDARLAELVPDKAAREWFLYGNAALG